MKLRIVQHQLHHFCEVFQLHGVFAFKTLDINHILGGLIFECEVKNKYISVLFANPNLFSSQFFFCIALVHQLHGYDKCQFNEALHAIIIFDD